MTQVSTIDPRPGGVLDRAEANGPDADRPAAHRFGPVDHERVWRLSDWLLRDGRGLSDNSALLQGLCERLAAEGVPIDRVTLHLRALHPDYRGVSRMWKPGEPLVERFMDHGIEKTAMYIESPVRACIEANRRLEWRLDQGGAVPFLLLDELRDEGYTHYVIAPLPFAGGIVNAISWATRRPGGFERGSACLCQRYRLARGIRRRLWRTAPP